MPTKSIKVVEGGHTAPIKRRTVKLRAFDTYLLITRADRSLRSLVAHRLQPLKLTPTEWLLMGVVEQGDNIGVSVSSTASQLNVTVAQVTTLSIRLMSAKLLRQRTQQSDRRSRHLILTTKGRNLQKKAEIAVSSALDEWLKPIPENYLAFYRRVIKLMANRQVDKQSKAQNNKHHLVR